MGGVRKALLWVGLAALLAGTLPAWAVEATLVADTHVNSALPGVNSGAISNLNVGAGYTALLQFDLGVLPAGTTAGQVSRAVLRLYCNRADAAGLVSVRSVDGAWGEYSVTYATLPPLGSVAQVAQVDDAGAYVAVDVTAEVQGWLTAPATNHGVALTADAAGVQFDSKENDLTGHAAVLDVTLATAGAAGPIGPAGPIGLTGAAGAVGPAGTPGLPGVAGVAGPAGPKGDTGVAGPIGPAGPSGAVGPAGPIGATGAAGPAGVAGTGMVFRGSYLSTVNYAVNDAVSFQGASYISVAASNQGNAPGSNPDRWSVLAAEGAAGMQGPAGATGSAGPQGAAGPQGVPGASGAAGAVGINYRGAWNSVASYQANDAASFGGSTYLAQVSSFGMQPDLYPAAWAVLAQKGSAGPTGPAGAAATVSLGTVATGAAGSPAAVTNSGTASAAVLNFTIPQGAAGTNGSGGGSGSASGTLPGSMYHAVSFYSLYYSVSNTNAAGSEDPSILTWVPAGCTATTLSVYSQQMQAITVTLRQGTPGNMADTALVCTAASGGSCSVTGSVAVAAASFVDLRVNNANATAAAVWIALTCN
jgi:hypothetical protein